MKEYDLSQAVDGLSQQVSALATLWGIYAAATFTASGFGISMGNRFTISIAIFLTVGFLAFTYGHWILVRNNVRTQQVIAAEIRARLDGEGERITDYAQSIRAICGTTSTIKASRAAHVVIDVCVLLIIWLTAGLWDWV